MPATLAAAELFQDAVMSHNLARHVKETCPLPGIVGAQE